MSWQVAKCLYGDGTLFLFLSTQTRSKVMMLLPGLSPDLGEPFGVMRCVLCACEAVSGPNGCGWGPCGSGSAEVLGRRMDPELLKRKKPVCRYLG